MKQDRCRFCRLYALALPPIAVLAFAGEWLVVQWTNGVVEPPSPVLVLLVIFLPYGVVGTWLNRQRRKAALQQQPAASMGRMRGTPRRRERPLASMALAARPGLALAGRRRAGIAAASCRWTARGCGVGVRAGPPAVGISAIPHAGQSGPTVRGLEL